jgi:hypothetical protein
MTLEEEVQQHEAYYNSIEGIRDRVKTARDSVWVINNEIQKKSESVDGVLTKEAKGNIERNVAHLEIILSITNVTDTGEDLSELEEAIVAGKAALAE